MNKNHLKNIFSGIIVLATMLFLYFNTQVADPNKHQKILFQFSLFNQEDAILNQNILEIRQGLLLNYDPIVKQLNRLYKITNEINVLLKHIHSSHESLYSHEFSYVKKAVDDKNEISEGFKSSNALLRNSLRYIPTASASLVQQLPQNKTSAALKRTIDHLLQNILIYNITNEPDLLIKINTYINTLKKEFSEKFPALNDDADIFIRHANIIIKMKKQTNRYVSDLINAPTSEKLNQLALVYSSDHAKLMQHASRYRQVLYGFSVILIFYIAYILYRLNQTASTLRATIRTLNYQKFAMDQHVIVSITNTHGDITYVNQKFCDISQQLSKDLLGKNHRISNSNYHPSSFYKELWDTIQSGKVWHGKIRNKAADNSFYWVDTTIVPFLNDSGEPYQYMAIRTDITEIKQVEELLTVQAAALEATAQGIVITDAQGNTQWVNQAYSNITGYSKEEVIGGMSRLCGTKPPVDQTTEPNTESSTKPKTKERAKEKESTFCDDMWQTIQSGSTWHGDFINHRKDGTEYREELSISPVLNEQGEVSRFIAISQDITERQLTEKTLRRSQRMDALGKLTGGVAHDFNNMLGIVLGYTSLLKDAINHENIDKKTQATLIDYADEILRSGNKGAKLTEKLLSFSRHKISSSEIINLNDVLYDQQQMIEKTLTARIQLTLELTDDIWPININTTDLEDAIYNISINTMHAIDNNGKLTIRTSNEKIDTLTAKALQFPLSFPTGDYVLLSFTDTGCGMDSATQERMFEPFYTTKEQFGTGLGLSQVYGFVERSGGIIKVYSNPNHGTQLALYFPKYEILDSTDTESDSANTPTNYAGTETILLVDDEPALLSLTSKILESHGYKTLCAEHAEQALEILKNQPIDLLFSDVIMPDMDGYQLAAIVIKEHPNVKIQLASGFTDNRQNNAIDEILSKNILHKPYASETLLHRIRLLLDDSPLNQTHINTSVTDSINNKLDNTDKLAIPKNTQDNQNSMTSHTDKKNNINTLNGLTILIMDDDEDIRELFKLNIERLGCTVILATNADDTLELYQQSLDDKKPINALILDLNIPGSIGGKEVAKQIKQLNPSAKIIVSSGNSASAEMTNCKENGFDAAIEKNFNREIIKATLEEVLFS